jgi:hypothetical protein
MCIVITFAVLEPHFWTLDPLEQHARANQVEIDSKMSPLLQNNCYLETVFLDSLQFFHFYKFVELMFYFTKFAIDNACCDGHTTVKLTTIYKFPDIADIECFVTVSSF